MNLQVIKTRLKGILPLRALFLQEANCQITYDACHIRNWSDSYLFIADGLTVGYASVKGLKVVSDRDAIFEFYIIPPFRKMLYLFFSKLQTVSDAVYIECQSNGLFLGFEGKEMMFWEKNRGCR